MIATAERSGAGFTLQPSSVVRQMKKRGNIAFYFLGGGECWRGRGQTTHTYTYNVYIIWRHLYAQLYIIGDEYISTTCININYYIHTQVVDFTVHTLQKIDFEDIICIP